MNTKIILTFSAIFLASLLGIAGLTLVSLKKNTISVAEPSKEPATVAIATPLQMIEVQGDVFSKNEPVRGESIYLCSNTVFDQAYAEYRKNFDSDLKLMDNAGFTSTYSGVSLFTLKNPQACSIKARTDTNGHFHFQPVEQDKFFLAASANVNGQKEAWIQKINKTNYDKIIMR